MGIPALWKDKWVGIHFSLVGKLREKRWSASGSWKKDKLLYFFHNHSHSYRIPSCCYALGLPEYFYYSYLLPFYILTFLKDRKAKDLKFSYSCSQLWRVDVYNAQHTVNLVCTGTISLAYFIISSDLENATSVCWNKREKTTVLQFWRPEALKPVKVYHFKGILNIWCELNYLDRVGVLFGLVLMGVLIWFWFL